MNLDMTWDDLARAAGGRLVRGNPDEKIAGVSTDTRSVRPEQAVWALKGPRYDAHDYLTGELALKSAGWVVAAGRLEPSAALARNVVEVANPLKALQALAAAHRRRFDIPIVGITGSNGKTTTKEMLRCICRRVGPTCANSGNFNNELGVPLSLLELTSEHRYGIFEMGASRPGDIKEIARIAQPTLAVLTNIGPAHLEFFGALDATFRTKSEIIECLEEEGRVAINIDDPLLAGLEQKLGSRAVTYGGAARACVSFAAGDELIIDRHKVHVQLKAFGKLSRYNAAAAAAAAWALGIDADQIRLGLEDYQPGQMRLERRAHKAGCSLVIDSYNANPASMRAAIDGFCDEYGQAKKILVLGDMKELGPQSPRFHRELGERLASLPLEAAYLAGVEMKATQEALADAGAAFKVVYGEAFGDWIAKLRGDLRPGNALFFKASRAMKFEQLVESL